MVPDNNQQFGPTDRANFSVEDRPKNHGYRMIFITVTVILVAIGGFFVSKNEYLQQVIKNTIPNRSNQSGQATANYVPQPASSIANRQIPWLEVTSEAGTAASLNRPYTFTVTASSGGADIAGYDILLAIDPDLFEVQSITSEIASFSILQFEKGTHVTITGIKELGQNDASVFNDTPVLKVTVLPKKKGSTTISVLMEQNKEKTILVNTQVTPIPPQVGSLQVEVN